MDTEKPLCRFCWGTGNTKANPLLEPCECSGSIRFVHQRCLSRWRRMDTQRNAIRCLLCLQPYALQEVQQLEKVPTQGGILVFLLRYPIALCFGVNYIAVFHYSLSSPRVNIYVFFEWYQYIFQILYFCIFATQWDVQQKALYVKNLKKCIFLFVFFVHLMANVYIHKHDFFAILPLNIVLGMYWHGHIGILEGLNQEL